MNGKHFFWLRGGTSTTTATTKKSGTREKVEDEEEGGRRTGEEMREREGARLARLLPSFSFFRSACGRTGKINSSLSFRLLRDPSPACSSIRLPLLFSLLVSFGGCSRRSRSWTRRPCRTIRSPLPKNGKTGTPSRAACTGERAGNGQSIAAVIVFDRTAQRLTNATQGDWERLGERESEANAN